MGVFECIKYMRTKCVNVPEKRVYLSVFRCIQVCVQVCECIGEAGVFKCI